MRFIYGLPLLLLLGRANASPLPDQTSSGEAVNITNIAPYFNYHTECYVGGTKYIYFLEPTSPNVTLSISAGWKIRYPKDLANVLVKNGFEMITPHTTNCGWTIVSKVSNAAVYRGEIGFKQTKGLDATTYYLPKEETVTRIEEVLRSTFPKVEITVIVLAFTIIIWGPVIYFLFKWSIRHWKNPMKKRECKGVRRCNS